MNSVKFAAPQGQVADRVVIVTGGAVNLGRSYALALANQGAHVVVSDIVDGSPVVNEIAKLGGDAMSHRADITRADELEELVAATVDRYGRVDALVNNAGYFRAAKEGGGDFESVGEEEIDRCLLVNVKGTWLASRAVLPVMREQGYGKIINVSSGSMFKGETTTGAHYIAAKAGIFGLTRAMAREFGRWNIAVNTLVPDAISDDVASADYGDTPDRAVVARCFQREETHEDMVGTVLFLCSGASDFVTGQSFHVNGGSYFC